MRHCRNAFVLLWLKYAFISKPLDQKMMNHRFVRLNLNRSHPDRKSTVFNQNTNETNKLEWISSDRLVRICTHDLQIYKSHLLGKSFQMDWLLVWILSGRGIEEVIYRESATIQSIFFYLIYPIGHIIVCFFFFFRWRSFQLMA